MYNCTWIHHEVCLKLFTITHAVSREKFYRSYLHDLTCHSGQQYEIVCLRSVNAECQERLFGQAKRTALNTTNRKPNNVIPEILLRLQMRQKEGTLIDSVSAKQSKVSAAAKDLPKYRGTMISKEFLSSRASSWQAHLERLSTFLVLEPGVWWKEDGISYVFYDGDDDPNFRDNGPKLHHFRNTSLTELQEEKQEPWREILHKGITIPAQKVTVYDDHGDPVDYWYSEQDIATPPTSPQQRTRDPSNTHEEAPDHQYSPLSTTNELHVGDSNTCDTTHQYATLTEAHSETSISSSNIVGNLPSPSTPNFRSFSAQPEHTPQHTIGTRSLCKLIFETDEIGGDQTSVSPSLPEEEEQTTVINTDDSSLVIEDQQQISDLQTSYGKAIAKAIGRSEEVLRFDKLRTKIRSNSNCCSIMREQHDRLLSQLQVTLLRTRTDKLNKLRNVTTFGTSVHLTKMIFQQNMVN